MYQTVTLRAVDDSGSELFHYTVPLHLGMNVQQIMESAFVLNQCPLPNPDPFVFTVRYYGYSEDPQYPGYLGYEIEAIGKSKALLLPTNDQFYWELLINGVASTNGADTTHPGPGSTVLWQYVAEPASPAALNARARTIHSRRAAGAKS